MIRTDIEIEAATLDAARFVRVDRVLHKELFERAEKPEYVDGILVRPPAIVVEAPDRFYYDPRILDQGSAEEREGYQRILDEAKWRGFTVRPLDKSRSALHSETLHK